MMHKLEIDVQSVVNVNCKQTPTNPQRREARIATITERTFERGTVPQSAPEAGTVYRLAGVCPPLLCTVTKRV